MSILLPNDTLTHTINWFDKEDTLIGRLFLKGSLGPVERSFKVLHNFDLQSFFTTFPHTALLYLQQIALLGFFLQPYAVAGIRIR